MEKFAIDHIGSGFCCDRSSSATIYTRRLSLLHRRSVPYSLPNVGSRSDLSSGSIVFDPQTLMTEVTNICSNNITFS